MRIFLKYFLAPIVPPIVVGAVMLVGQFLIQPIIAEKSLMKEKIWQDKFNTFSKAIELVNQLIQSQPLQKYNYIPKIHAPDPLTINNYYAKLLFISEDPEIARIFLSFFVETSPYGSQNIFEKRKKLLSLCRKELKLKKCLHIMKV